MYIFKAAVVGAGAMGGEIAQVITYSGLPVVMKDVDLAMLDKGMARIRKIYEGRVAKGKMSASEMDGKLALVTPALTYDDFGDVDIVIEAVPEIMSVKQKVYRELDEVCPEATIFASNTSALSISEMGQATKRPHKVIGMHFFNPAHVMKLVEIVRGEATDQETVDDVVSFTESLRKIPVVVKECPGFLVNRLLMPYPNEAVLALQENAATAAEIDEAMVGYGWPMGPFVLMDFLDLDVCYHVGEYLFTKYGDRMKGADGVYVVACPLGNCHHVRDNERGRARVARTRELLQSLGLEGERVDMFFVSGGQGATFAKAAREMTERVKRLGPSPLKK